MPYARTTSRLPRGCVFAGTLNPDGAAWNKDRTGGRRFWPVTATKVELEKLKADARSMMADAVALEGMQAGCERFVAEMHDNAKETEAFLAGLR
jgi:predicted P-loop ATPase